MCMMIHLGTIITNLNLGTPGKENFKKLSDILLFHFAVGVQVSPNSGI